MSSVRQRTQPQPQLQPQPSTAAIDQDPDSISIPSSSSDKLLVNLRKQAKFILIGYAGIWYLQVPLHFTEVIKMGGWAA